MQLTCSLNIFPNCMNMPCNCWRASLTNSVYKLFSDAINFCRNSAVRINIMLYHAGFLLPMCTQCHRLCTIQCSCLELSALSPPSLVTKKCARYYQAASQYYVDTAYCYRRISVICLSVCLSQSRALQKRLNRSRCRLGCGVGWAQGNMY